MLAGRLVCARPCGPYRRSWNACVQRPAVDPLDDEAEEGVVGVAVVVVGAGREQRGVPEGDVQHLLRRPDLRRVGVQGVGEAGVVRVAVQAAAHRQQLGDRDVLAVRHPRDVPRHGIGEPQLPLLRQQQRHRGGHRLGDRGDADVGAARGRHLRTPLRRPDGGRELALGGADLHHGAGDHQLRGGRLDHGREGGGIDRLHHARPVRRRRRGCRGGCRRAVRRAAGEHQEQAGRQPEDTRPRGGGTGRASARMSCSPPLGADVVVGFTRLAQVPAWSPAADRPSHRT